MLKSSIKNWKRIDDDMAADVAQRERSKIKCYASAFSNILIKSIIELTSQHDLEIMCMVSTVCPILSSMIIKLLLLLKIRQTQHCYVIYTGIAKSTVPLFYELKL